MPGLKDMKEVLDLCVSLWGHLRPRPSEAVDDDKINVYVIKAAHRKINFKKSFEI